MFMASNQYKVFKGHEEAFESYWTLKRETLQSAAGFISDRFTKGREAESSTTYMALMIWENEASFLVWRFGRAVDREWVDVSGPQHKRAADLDAMIPAINPQ